MAGSAVDDLLKSDLYPAEPSAAEITLRLSTAAPSRNYGERLRTLLTVPTAGTYRFNLTTDGEAQLWMSGELTGRNKALVARIGPAVDTVSRWVELDAGRAYYIEVLHKVDSSIGGLGVTWSTPGDSSTARDVPSAGLRAF